MDNWHKPIEKTRQAKTRQDKRISNNCSLFFARITQDKKKYIVYTVQIIAPYRQHAQSICRNLLNSLTMLVSSRFPSLKDVASIGEAHLKLMKAGSRDDLAPAANHDRIWGPILKPAAKGCGALAAASSVLLFPTKLAPETVRSVVNLLPDALVLKMSATVLPQTPVCGILNSRRLPLQALPARLELLRSDRCGQHWAPAAKSST